jgi:hypothetical protein
MNRHSTGIWASSNAIVLRRFIKLDLATRKMLKEELVSTTFFSQPGRLDELGVDLRVAQKRTSLLYS